LYNEHGGGDSLHVTFELGARGTTQGAQVFHFLQTLLRMGVFQLLTRPRLKRQRERDLFARQLHPIQPVAGQAVRRRAQHASAA
jgi:hypothetical protein